MRTIGTFDISPLIYTDIGSRNTVLLKKMNIIHSECLGQHIYYISTNPNSLPNRSVPNVINFTVNINHLKSNNSKNSKKRCATEWIRTTSKEIIQQYFYQDQNKLIYLQNKGINSMRTT